MLIITLVIKWVLLLQLIHSIISLLVNYTYVCVKHSMCVPYILLYCYCCPLNRSSCMLSCVNHWLSLEIIIIHLFKFCFIHFSEWTQVTANCNSVLLNSHINKISSTTKIRNKWNGYISVIDLFVISPISFVGGAHEMKLICSVSFVNGFCLPLPLAAEWHCNENKVLFHHWQGHINTYTHAHTQKKTG